MSLDIGQIIMVSDIVKGVRYSYGDFEEVLELLEEVEGIKNNQEINKLAKDIFDNLEVFDDE